MQDINDDYEFIKLIANKNQQGFLSPGQFNRARAAAELQLFKERDSPPEQYQPGRPVPRTAYGLTRKSQDDLDPFIVRTEYVPTASQPFWTRPPRMLRPLAVLAAFEDELVEVEDVPHLELGSRLRSTFMAPDLEHPIIVYGAGQAQVYPEVVARVLITYLRTPVVAEWVGDQVGGRLVYNASKSTQSEWPADCRNDINIRTLSFLGINLKAQDLVQYAAMKKAEGI